MNRRQFLAAGAAAVAGCGTSSSQSLRIFVYAGGHEETMRQVFLPAFQAATGQTATLYPGWWDGIPKLQAAPPGDPPFDLVITDATQGFPAAKGGLFQEFDPTNIPNLKLLADAAKDTWVFRDRLGVTYPDAVMTLGYNKDLVPNPPTRWADLLRPELKGKVGLYRSFYMSLFTAAAVLADVTNKPGTAHQLIETKLDEVMRFAREEIKPRVGLWWPNTTDMILALANKTAAAGNMQSPEYLTALKEKPTLGAAVPAADRAFVLVFWAIPAGTKQKSLAEKAIDVLFSPDVQLGFARRGSAAAIPSVAEAMAKEDAFWQSLYPHTPEQFAAVKYYPYDAYAARWDRLADEWDRTVLR